MQPCTPTDAHTSMLADNPCSYAERPCLPAAGCSLLQQLQGELQSGTFDLKAAGPTTETITLDCSAMAQHAATTPAPSIGLGVKAGLSGHPSTVRAPPSVLATAGHPRGSSMASCLKAPAATAAAGATAGPHDHHVARAVTFAADVHDAGVVLGTHAQSHRAGELMQCAGFQRLAVSSITLCQLLNPCRCFDTHQSIELHVWSMQSAMMQAACWGVVCCRFGQC
jgi:hypothetical protein